MLHAVPLVLEAATKKKSSGGSYILLLVVLVGFGYLMISRRRGAAGRAGAARRGEEALEIGREVLTRAGIVARVRGFDGDQHVLLEIAPGTVVRMVRTMVGTVLPLPASPEVAGAGGAQVADDPPEPPAVGLIDPQMPPPAGSVEPEEPAVSGTGEAPPDVDGPEHSDGHSDGEHDSEHEDDGPDQDTGTAGEPGPTQT